MRIRLSLALFLCLLSFGFLPAVEAGSSANDFYAGSHKVDITPLRSVYMGGQSLDRKSQGVHDPLSCRALAMKSGDTTVVIASLDVLGLSFIDVEAGPDTIGLYGKSLSKRFSDFPVASGRDERYMAYLRFGAINCVNGAIQNLQPAELYLSQSNQWDLSRNSRVPDSLDQTMAVLRAVNKEGKTIAVLFNFGAHAEVLKGKKEISADFLGPVYREVEREFGGTAIFVNGALGAMVGPAENGKKPESNWESMEKYGKRFAEAVILTARDGWRVENPDIAIKREVLKIPLQNFRFRLAMAFGLIPERSADGRITSEINFWRLGPAWIVTVPGEPYPAFAELLRRRMSGVPNFIFSLANDELGYVMFENDCRKKLYDYERSMAVSCKIGHQLYEELSRLMGQPLAQKEKK
ncbi:MAG: hypothetical protein UX53_C0012G0010 [Candidatus Azambacteria bacterium GW2011_GWB2_46_37]|uniref:Uncharacterized protein n=1 Tax=Candidatus Azambacteria bacterium GW2011_GWB2_46_37 TaxID=1618618 RepID=A0A0G1Q299_9BACT|nr:MAG: hypothetical protein UX53_C0012G0010 [Candidatus Azambacteria bacterium GW2011_GWB2_46_37]